MPRQQLPHQDDSASILHCVLCRIRLFNDGCKGTWHCITLFGCGMKSDYLKKEPVVVVKPEPYLIELGHSDEKWELWHFFWSVNLPWLKDSKDEGGFEYSGSRKAESSWSTSSTMVGCSTIEVFLLNSWPCCCLLPAVQGRVQEDILKVLSCSQVMSNLSFFCREFYCATSFHFESSCCTDNFHLQYCTCSALWCCFFFPAEKHNFS